MTAIDRSMPAPDTQRSIHELAAATQQIFAENGVSTGYLYAVPARGQTWPVRIMELHRYSAECMLVLEGEEVTFLVPLPEENWPQ